ncbi:MULTISPECIES: hypothetical protein [Pseudomonadota]|uniref:hypothetical protein n=1 Tax=Pseudomonadota TaxID=1224 RepID=UPI00262892A1|nr:MULTISPECIES: hypothetical protein [Pseudomonadota]
MRHRLPEHIVRLIEDAIEASELRRANFDGMSEDVRIGITHLGGNGNAERYDSPTAYIREKVKLHHNSWIAGPLRQVLEWSQTSDDGTQEEYDIVNRLRQPLVNPSLLEDAAQEIERLKFNSNIQLATITTIKKALADQPSLKTSG